MQETLEYKYVNLTICTISVNSIAQILQPQPRSYTNKLHIPSLWYILVVINMKTTSPITTATSLCALLVVLQLVLWTPLSDATARDQLLTNNARGDVDDSSAMVAQQYADADSSAGPGSRHLTMFFYHWMVCSALSVLGKNTQPDARFQWMMLIRS